MKKTTVTFAIGLIALLGCIAASGLRRSFVLSDLPEQESIEVSVFQGETEREVRNDRNSGWVYAESTNSIFFGGSYLPPAGSAIEVFYELHEVM